jgi:hypothetical protein
MRTPMSSYGASSTLEVDEVPGRNASLSMENGRRSRHHVEVKVVVYRLIVDVTVNRGMTRNDIACRPEHYTGRRRGVNDVAHAHPVNGENHSRASRVDQG